MGLIPAPLTEQFDQPGLWEKQLRDVASIYQGNIFFGEDGMEISVDGPTMVHLD